MSTQILVADGDRVVICDDGVVHADHPRNMNTRCGIAYMHWQWNVQSRRPEPIPVTCMACIALGDEL